MFSTDFIFRQQENLVDNQKCQAGFQYYYILKARISQKKLCKYIKGYFCLLWLKFIKYYFRALNRNNIILAKGLLYLIPCSLEKEICRSLSIKTTNPNPNSQEGRLGGLV